MPAWVEPVKEMAQIAREVVMIGPTSPARPVTKFFDLHIVSDEIHGERGYQIVLEHATTVELQQRCIKICEVGAQMRLLYTTALYNDYVAPELALAA